jgi:hypothetical protein
MVHGFALRVDVLKNLLLHDAFLPFFLFSDHCAVLELGYLKSGKNSLSGAGQVLDIPDKRSFYCRSILAGQVISYLRNIVSVYLPLQEFISLSGLIIVFVYVF